MSVPTPNLNPDRDASQTAELADSAIILERFDKILSSRLAASSITTNRNDTHAVATSSGPTLETARVTDGTVGQVTGRDNTGQAKDENSDNEVISEWLPELTKLVQFKDLRGNSQVIHANDFIRRKRNRKKPIDHRWRGHALVLRRILNIDLGLVGNRLELRSPGLCGLFKKIARGFQELDLDTKPIIIHSPFRSLFYRREKLEEFIKPDCNEVSEADKTQIRELLKFVSTEPVLQRVVTAYDDLVPRKKITLSLHWTLFRPHEWIYFRGGTGPSVNDTESVGYLVKIEPNVGLSGRATHTLHYVLGYHSGHNFFLSTYMYHLKSTSDEVVELTTDALYVLPLRFLPIDEQAKIRNRLIARGKRYVELCRARCTLLHYVGTYGVSTTDHAKMLGAILDSSRGERSEFSTSQRIMIDRQAQREQVGAEYAEKSTVAPCLKEYVSHLLDEPQAAPNGNDDVDVSKEDDDIVSIQSSDTEESLDSDDSIVSKRKGKRVKKKKKRDMVWVNHPLSDDDYLLCPPTLIGFLLHNKLWGTGIKISGLKKIAWKDDPYLSLQLPEEKKALVKNLVQGFDRTGGSSSNQDLFEDVIEGKGRGIVFLLHGPPGLGKTMTAESVAESARRPLYHVSTGELSVDVSKLEKQLTDVFRLGLRWGAVVLIDEADVLMARRSTTELTRNAIVAVFLRLIEYYHGMLFLTTNRIEDFDDAFYNRIHVSIRYEPLKIPERSNIWRQHLTRACKRNKNTSLWPEDALGLLAELEMNGRDIRNFTRTAFGYARAVNQDLDISHVVLVVRNNLSLKPNLRLEEFLERLEDVDRKVKASHSNTASENTSTESGTSGVNAET